VSLQTVLIDKNKIKRGLMMVTYLWRGTRIDDWFRISIKG